jgi:hypothetical protein
LPSLNRGSLPHDVIAENGGRFTFLNPQAPPACMRSSDSVQNNAMHHCTAGGMHNETMDAPLFVYVPSSSGPAPVGAPYQVALAASQPGSAVRSEALKLTGLAHEPHVTRSKKRGAPSATTTVEDKVVAITVYLRGQLAVLVGRQEKFCVCLDGRGRATLPWYL